MRLLVDMFPCQTYSRMRGIGRYTLSLTREMARLRAENEMVALVDALYPERVEELRQIFVSLLPAGAFLPYYHNSLEDTPWLTNHPYSDMAEALIEQAYQVVSPDVVLTPSLFEGWGGGAHGKVPLPDKKYPNQQRAVILYDIIPLVFQKQYLDPDPLLKEWYLERIEMLQNYDLLLAISDATRQDAIKILGLNPNKVINISGAASSHFKRIELSEQQKQKYLNRFGISRPFVLYLGGNDFRKNMDGALRAFAKLPPETIHNHQLVLNDVGDETFFRSKARKLGLDDSDLVVFKRATDDELTALYNLSKVFFFPSFYEGFGLPVLEAMSCGTAVLASNNSSLPEVVGREDALFDVNDEQEIVDALNKVLTDDAFRADLAAYGLERAKEFSWKISAQRAWKALEDLVDRKESSAKENNIVISEQTRYRIAYISPLPPQKSGIAEYSADFLPYLAEHFDIDLFTQPQLKVSDQYLLENFSIFSWDQLKERHHHYDTLLYHMGNAELHIPMWNLLEQLPGVVVNHDFFMSNLPFVTEVRTGEQGVFFDQMDKSHGLPGLLDYARQGREKSRWQWPMNWPLLKNAQELIVHSEHQNELIRKFYRHGWQPKPALIRQFRDSVPVVSPSQKRVFRKELNLDPNSFVFCSFGFMAPTKLNNLVIQAFSRALPELGERTKLIFVGELEGGEYGKGTLSLLRELNLHKKVRVTGYLSKEEYEKYLACADVAIQLRVNSRGETSRAVLDCLAYGLPTIVNAHGSLNDYPSGAVLKLSKSPSMDDLTRAILRMKRDDDFRFQKGQQARNLIVEKHHPEKIAIAYRQVITKVIRSKNQEVFAPLVDAIYELGSSDALLQTSAKLAAKNLTLRSQPRILVDVTGLDLEELSSGKKETVNHIKKLLSIKDPSIRIELVYVRENKLFRACRTVEKILNLSAHSLGPEKSILIRPGDVLVMFSSLVSTYRFNPVFYESIRQKGGKVVTVMQSASTTLSQTPIVESDKFLCISVESAEELRRVIENQETKYANSSDIFYLNANMEFVTLLKKSMTWLLDPGVENDIVHRLDETSSNGTLDSCAHYEICSSGQAEKQVRPNSVSPVDRQAFVNQDKIVEKTELSDCYTSETASIHSEGNASESPGLKSSPCTQRLLESDHFQAWVEQMKGRKFWMHRKLWEWAFIAQALHERGFLTPGKRGLGFAVGQEPLPSLFARYGCDILATDLATEEADRKNWVETNQHAAELKDLNKAKICPEDLFTEKVSFRFVDMNNIDEDLRDFDFLWSSCSIEHLGTLAHGEQFIYNAMDCLRPGGLAIHTTEFNISSNQDTIDDGPEVIYRQKDFEKIAHKLRSQGHKIELDFSLGQDPLDLQVDALPYKQDVHLRLKIGAYICTSFGLIIEKGA